MKEHYYFDNAATSWPKPESVYQYMDQFFRAYGVNPGRSGHSLAVEAETMIVQTRRLIGGFFGFTGDSERVVFTQNATDSLNLCFRGLVASGDHVIITRLEHNSVLRPANHMERDGGVSVTRLCGDGAGYVDPEDVRKAITDKTKMVVVNHASNVLGTLQDIEKMAQDTAEIVNLFDSMSIETENKIPLPHEVRQWAISTIFDCADRWEISFSGLFKKMLELLGKDLLKEAIRVQQVRDIFGIRAVDEIRNELGLT